MSQIDVHSIDAINSQGDGLRVEFFRAGSRWAHRLLAFERGVVRPLLESIEGDETQAFPPSPVLQQCDPSGAMLLLIGMAGKNHWSVGVEAFPDRRTVRMDVACRSQPCSLGQLGSCYRLLMPRPLGESGGLLVVAGAYQYELVPQRIDQIESAEVVVSTSDRVMVQAAIAPSVRTQRWCYEFQQTARRP